MGENICKSISDKGIAFKILKELLKVNNNKRNNLIKNGQNTWTDTTLFYSVEYNQ